MQDKYINEGFPILVNNQQDRGIYDTTQQNTSNYFILNNNTLVPNLLGSNAANKTAYNYMKIDLTDVDSSASYKVTVNASVNSEQNYDYGFATILEGTTSSIPTPPGFDSNVGQIMRISGSSADVTTDKDYSTYITGGKCYYLYLGYRKDSS